MCVHGMCDIIHSEKEKDKAGFIMAKKVERYFSAYSKICVQGGEGMNEQVEAVQRMHY